MQEKFKIIFRSGIAVALLIVGAGWIWVSRAPEGNSIHSGTSPYTGFQAPDFSLDSLNGGTIQLSDLKEKAVILNFWATWCLPCRTEMPAFQRLYLDFEDKGLEILAVNTTNQDNLSDVHTFIREKNINFPVLLDREGSISAVYKNQALPTTFFIDRNGIIRDYVIGGPISEALLRIKIENLLSN